MPKRISRKLLVGLGSIVTFGAVGTISGFGLKSIIDSTLNNQNISQFSSLAEANFDQINNYNVATSDMFINTTDLRKFHFGNVQTGQKVTPWGWLGVFESGAKKSKIALTGWNGEIIWINDDYGSSTDTRYNVYDMQYDWNSDRIFVLRTSSENGLQDGSGNFVPLQLDILDAKTGRSIPRSTVSDTWFREFENNANNEIKKKFVKGSSQYDKNRSRNLYYLDVAYASRNRASLVTWMPNFMQMADHNKKSDDYFTNKATLTAPTLADVARSWDKLTVSVLLNNNLIDQNKPAQYKRPFKLIQTAGRETGIYQDNSGTVYLRKENFGVDASKLYMLTNPFFTVGDDGDTFIIHLLMANVITTGAGQNQTHSTKQIYHKTIGFAVDYGAGADTSGKIVKKYTNLQEWSNDEFFELEGNASWAKSLGWNLNALNAYLRPTKNMFNQNSIVVPYPFGVSSHMDYGKWFPIFNVAQLKIDPSTGRIDTGTKESDYTSSINYNFGTQIKKYFDKNNGKYNSNTSLNNIYPYPGNSDALSNYNHSYNRLISVSPFDNTIIYAAKPNIRETIFDQTSANVNKWAGFWVANSWAIKNANSRGKYYRPLIVSADKSIVNSGNNAADADFIYMLNNVNDLYANGFAFDIRSLVDINGQKSLNLYFNQSGRGVNDSYTQNGFKSSKIGMLDDVLKVAPASDNNSEIVWVKNIANKYANANTNRAKELLATGITKKSYSSIIHSRADLTKWYQRTWNNINNPSNMYPRMTQLNASGNNSNRAIASRFGVKLTDSQFGNNESIDLVSAWKDKDNTISKNYDRLLVKRPIIKTGLDSDPNNLGLVTTYELPTDIFNLVTKKPGWGISKDTARLTLTNVQTAQNASVQILSAWADSYKMGRADKTTDLLGSLNAINWQQLITPKWLDKRSNANIQFGNGNNNNVSKTGTNNSILRLMLKLVKPTGTLPNWFSANNFPDAKFFNRAYPIEASYSGETTFKDIAKEFANQKAKTMDLSDFKNANTAVGIGNLKVEAYLELNPKYAGYGATDKIYTISGNGTLGGSKIIVDKSNGQVIIYKDSFAGSRTIYDQSQIDFDSFDQTGFGRDGTTLRTEIQKSWKDNTFNNNNIFNIKVSTDYNQLPDTLVRKRPNDNSSLFSFEYKSGTTTTLEITPNPADLQWFKNRFENFNRLLNLFVQFEYKATGQNNWNNLGGLLTDKSIKESFQNNNNKLVFSGVNSNIEKVRFRLKKFSNLQDKRLAIDMQNFDGNENQAKYISAEHGVAYEKYIVNEGQIRTVFFANPQNTPNKFINDITLAEINQFIDAVIAKSTGSTASARSKVTLKFDYNGRTNLTAQQLYDEIRNKLNRADPFVISGGNNPANGDIIKARFALKDGVDSVRFFNATGNEINGTALEGIVVSNLATKIDLAAYLNQISSAGLTVANTPTNPGSFNTNGSDIQFPNNQATTGFLANMSFNDIKTKLLAIGVKIRYKGYDPASKNFGNWQDDINSLRNYDPTNPAIKIGFQVINGWNVKVFDNTQEITDSTEKTIKLNLPKQFLIDTTKIDVFKADHGISGNTKIIQFDDNKLNKLINDLKAANQNADNAQLEVMFRLGTAGDFKSKTDFIKYLKDQTTDQTSNAIQIKFAINSADANNWFIPPEKAGEYTILPENNSTLKIYINDQGIFEKLNTETRVGGDNTNLSITWPNGFSVEPSTGVFTATPTKGVGLKLEFTFNSNLDPVAGATGTDVQTQWTSSIPNKFDINKNPNLYIRLQVVDVNKYQYERIPSGPTDKITLSLTNLLQKIELDGTWLRKPVVSNNTETTSFNLDQYEQAVFASMTSLSDDVKGKIKIVYNFNNEANLSKEQVLEKIKNYKNNSNSANSDFKILQLWNGNSGKKITSTFAKKEATGNYELTWKDATITTHELDTSKVITTIDFSSVLSWLQSIKVSFANNSITIPNVSVAGNIHFDGQPWTQIEQNLKNSFGITIQYRKVMNNNQPNESEWSEQISSIDDYNPQIGKFQIRFLADGTKSKNIQFKPTTNANEILDGATANAKSKPFDVNLQVKLRVVVDPQFTSTFNSAISPTVVSGNTRNLTIDAAAEQKLINDIKQANVKINPAFSSLNLEVKYQLGQWQVGDPGKTRTEFQTYLANQTNVDQATNRISYAINVSPDQTSQFEIVDANYPLHEHETPSPTTKIKYFVNKRNWEANADKVTITGTNNNLNWNFSSFNNGSTSASEQSGSVYLRNEAGNALQLQFTTNANASYNDNQVSSDLNDLATKWITKKPTSIPPAVKEIKIRIVPTSGFEYESATINSGADAAKVHTIIPQITTQITVDANWLNKQFGNNGQEITIDSFNNVAMIDTYETKVKEAAKVDPTNPVDVTLLDKFNIEYQFDNENAWISKSKLIEKIQQYKNNTNQSSLGILQLWNNQAGVKIKSKFVDADANDSYSITIINNNEQIIDTTNVITKIDFTSVLEWLKQLEVGINESANNGISSLNIPNVKNGIEFFGGKTWAQVQTALQSFGITIWYSNNIKNETENWGPNTTSVNKYDPTNPSFKIKFKTDGTKSKNIKFRLSTNEELNGATSSESAVSLINIKAKLLVEIPPNLLATFKANANIRGNTKSIEIDQALVAEQALIEAIIEHNKQIDNRYDKLNGKLEIQYALTDRVDNNTTWKKLNEFKSYLANQQTDQTTNQIQYKIVLTDLTNFNISNNDASAKILSDKQLATDANIKIKYYINPGIWETNADRIQVNGTSDNLQWNFSTIFSGKVEERNDGKVYLRTDAGLGLQVYFTTKVDADYNSPSLSDNGNELSTKWVSIKPNAINASTQNLKIKLVAANNGYVYGPSETGATPPAKAHNVTITVQKVLYVNKEWFNPPLVNSEVEISALNKQTHLVPWEQEVYKKLATQNNVNDAVAKKIDIKYFFDDNKNEKFHADELIQKITQLRADYNNDQTLGIIQLWNGTQGKKLNAIFESADKNYIIRVQGNPNQPSEDQIKKQLDTTKVFTNVSLVKYVEILTSEKTEVQLDTTSNQEGKITSFNPPAGKNPSGIFHGKTYDQIAKRLQELGVQIEFSKDKTNWLPKDKIKEYDIQKNSLYLRFTINSINIRLQLKSAVQIGPNENSGTTEIRLPLNVPKYIVIDNTKAYWELTKQFNFSGTTKNIQFSESKINEFLTAIKKQNATDGNDPAYESAPIEIQFQVGSGSTFTEISRLKEYLSSQTRDLPDRVVNFQFALKSGANPQEWKIKNPGIYPLLADDKQNQIKIHINDNGVFDQLSKMVINGTNDRLVWNWPQLVNVNPNGVLNPNDIKHFGQGLKFEFTFKPNPNINDPIGTNQETQWVSDIPVSYDANKGFTNVYLRIKLTDANRYYYEHANKMISRSLDQVGQTINLKAEWLAKVFNGGNEIELENLLAVNKIEEYENEVKKAAQAGGISASLLNKFTIKYQFNFGNSVDSNQLVDKNGLIAKIKEYQNKKDQIPFGILQLWNGQTGIKIVAKFVDADSGDKFAINVSDLPDYKIINTDNVITTIDFSKVINWLITTRKLVKVNGTTPAATLSIPNVDAADDLTFNQKEWSKVSETLKTFGITAQYRKMLSATLPNDDTNWEDDLTRVKEYDENIGKIQIRFKFDNTKAENIKFKTSDKKIYIGKTDPKTDPFELSLDIKLTVDIDNNIVNNTFLSKADVIGGNTKYLDIKKSYEDDMIEKLVQDNVTNNEAFNNAGLNVKYKLAHQNDWKSRQEFIDLLRTDSRDQSSNKVVFKFEVTNQTDFQVNDQEWTLFDPTTIANPNDWKVKLFINNANWESAASGVSVTGKTSALNWNWNGLKIQEQNGKVGTAGLQVEFSAKNNAGYDDPAAVENGNLKTEWITTKPQTLDSTIQNLFIRIKAKSGYVYGPAYAENGNQKIAKAHRVNLEIKREILVNPKDLSTSLSIDGVAKPFVTDISQQAINKFVEDGLDQISEQSLRKQVTVKFNFNGNTGLSATGLYNEIRKIISSNVNPKYGILQLWNDVAGDKIEAYYELVNPRGQYELITKDGIAPNEKQVVITGHIKTKINLVDIVNDLKNKKIEFTPIDNKNHRDLITIKNWIMPTTKDGSDPLNRLSWQAFEQRLKEVGVLIKVRIVNNPDTNKEWKSLDDLKQYNDTTLQLGLRFELDNQQADNIVLSVISDGDIDSTTNQQSLPEFKMNIKAPATVTINSNHLTQFINGYQISGNTKNIQLDESAENKLIQAIFNDNISVNNQVFQDLQNRLFIEYYLGKDGATVSDDKWKIRSEFINDLEQTNTDQVTNEIWFRLNVKNPPGDDVQTFNINKTPKQLIAEKIANDAKVKIFINDNGLETRAKSLKAIGSTEAVEIQGLTGFNSSIPNGLSAQWSNIANPNDQDWTDQVPTSLNADKNLWIRFKSSDGYVYEKAIQQPQGTYTQYSDKYAINTEGLKVILKLQKEWLTKIKITNHTIDPKIDEQNSQTEIDKVLPTNKKDLIKIQYHIKGFDQWFDKNQFIAKLKELKGAKDSKNFILKREEIEVRYSIKEGETDYSLNIDNVNITDANESQYYVQLIDDAKQQNDDFEGDINVDLITEFTKENFKIQGSTTRPQFIISNRQKLESYFAPYVSDRLFDIIYSTQYDAKTDKWTWDESKSILNNGQLINQDGLINQQVQIGPDKKFALKFISKNNKYKVYKNNTKQDEGYILDLSDNVTITVEIENPFTKANKTLGLWTREDNKQGKYFQGQGGFKIVVANKDDFSIDSNNIQSAQEFLESSALAENEKDALEFVYHIFGSNPTKEEVDRIQKTINDHQSSDWKQFSNQTKNSDNWSGDLGLKVGDYVAVAIRVKSQYSQGDNAFVIKGNDYSMILPMMKDTSGKDKKPGRISGYKIKTDAIKLDEQSVSLLSMINPELPPLDGWSWLSKLNLRPDSNGNYLGVDLDLQLYNEFYTKQGSNQIWISGSGAKLVKRESSGQDIIESGVYKDASGANIKDENNQDIKVYKNSKTNRLSNPIKQSQATKTKQLENLGNGAFRLTVDASDQIEQGKLSLFRNQDVDLKLVASKGEGTEELPDFYLDSEKTIPLKNIISPKIKYPIENEKQISYSWNYEDFAADSIEYDAVGKNDKPEDGAAKIKTIFKLFKKINNSDTSETITGETSQEAVKVLQETLAKDFDNQLKFQVVYSQVNGSETTDDTNNIYKFDSLKNRDRISLKIVAKAEDLYYVEAPRPLIINVNGLTEAAPTQSKLQYLRVQQNGLIDGQGSFKVLVSNPNNPDEDERFILKGWKFMVRVWDKDLDEKGQRQIKINWTDDQSSIKNLSNGDKVEWKLVSEDGNPVKDAYYNTVALEHKADPVNGQISYNFAQVNYPNGNDAYNVISKGIGAYPETDDQYPEKSGFIINGLKDKSQIFQISKENFAKVLAQLQPSYVGINTQGTIHFDQKYFDENYWVNTNGELYVKKDQNNLKEENDNQPKEISLVEFLDYVTFYTHDPVIANYQGGFKFSGNDININNHLTNGDQMWATFDTTGVNDNSGLNNNDPTSSLTTRLLDVSGLKDIIDPMSPLWYVLMALAGIATLGTAALVAFLVARHKKLKGK